MRARALQHLTLVAALAVAPLTPLLVAGATAPSAVGVEVTNGAPAASGIVAATTPDVGRWRVTQVGARAYKVTWTSPRPLPVTDARPEIVGGQTPLGGTQVEVDGRSVSVVVTASSPPEPDDFDVLLSGQRLDETTSTRVRPGQGTYREPTKGARLRADPGTPGQHLVESFDYRRAPTKIAGLPAKVEMLGHVVRPADANSSSPLVLFLHGRHAPCYQTGDIDPPRRDWPCMHGLSPIPSYLGYDYAQKLLASQGYVTVSISANSINAQDYQLPDGGAAARATLVERHLDQWARWIAHGTYSADLDNVILVGHSRGGEGVDRASIDIRLTAPYRITGQVLIGPTDFGYQAAPYIPSVTMLPYCDGDVSDLQGQMFTDQPRDLTTDDPALHSSVLVMGANHNFFNSEWTPGVSVAPSNDDWYGPVHKTCGRQSPTRLSAADQRRVGKTYIAGAVHLFASGDESVLPLFDGSAVSAASAGFADVRSSAIGGGRELRRPGIDVRLGPSTGAATSLCRGRAQGFGAKPRLCSSDSSVRTPHWIVPYGVPADRVFEMSWTASHSRGGLEFASPLDASTAASLDLRTIVDPARGDVRLKLRLYDGSGGPVTLTPARGGLLPALPGGGYSLGKEWAQTLRVDLAAVNGLDLSHLTRVDLVAGNDHGHVWVLDVAAVPPSLPEPPVKRIPRLDLRNVSQVEGDGPGQAFVEVPYRVTGSLLSPAKVTVLVQTDEAQIVRQLTLAPGIHAGTISIPYDADTTDDPRVRRFWVAAYATRSVMTDRYLATARVLDDDPTPALTVEAVAPAVTEGTPAQWRVTLAQPVDYELLTGARPVQSDSARPELEIGDLPRHYVRRHVYPIPPADTALSKARLSIYDTVRTGHTRTVVELPTAVDQVREGREVLTVRIRFPRTDQPPQELQVLVRDAV